MRGPYVCAICYSAPGDHQIRDIVLFLHMNYKKFKSGESKLRIGKTAGGKRTRMPIKPSKPWSSLNKTACIGTKGSQSVHTHTHTHTHNDSNANQSEHQQPHGDSHHDQSEKILSHRMIRHHMQIHTYLIHALLLIMLMLLQIQRL